MKHDDLLRPARDKPKQENILENPSAFCSAAHRDEFTSMFESAATDDAEAFLKPYYIGHHTPLGNFVTALALKDTLVGLLDPRPLPYSKL